MSRFQIDFFKFFLFIPLFKTIRRRLQVDVMRQTAQNGLRMRSRVLGEVSARFDELRLVDCILRENLEHAIREGRLLEVDAMRRVQDSRKNALATTKASELEVYGGPAQGFPVVVG